MEYVISQKENMKAELEKLLIEGKNYIIESSEAELGYKLFPIKWSKKEIIGHLIDSGIYNLQRFSEIQYKSKPFVVQPYNQNELVKANNYQQANTRQILDFWLAINSWIVNIIDLQTEETLAYEIRLGNGEISDLKFLIEDYIGHLKHHLNQITNN